jgi:hypothetical protein
LPASYLSKQGRINNVLLAQTITLGLNIGFSSGLGNFALQANKWLVTADVVECGSKTIKDCKFSCTPVLDPITGLPVSYTWTVTYSPYHVGCTISQALYDALTTKNVSGLYLLANKALCNFDGTVGTESGITLDEIESAVDCINNAFDECKSFVTWASGDVAPTANSFCTPPSSSTPCPPIIVSRSVSGPVSEAVSGDLNVTAYPNPFNDRVKFTILSKVSGQAQLEVYNTMGQKVSTLYNGYLQANRTQIVEYKISGPGKSSLIYILRVGGKHATGKLLHIE